MGDREGTFLPATNTTKSVVRVSNCIAAERKVSPAGFSSVPGGQESKALSRPIREDSPAAKITPAKLGDRAMQRTIAERNHIGTVAHGRARFEWPTASWSLGCLRSEILRNHPLRPWPHEFP